MHIENINSKRDLDIIVQNISKLNEHITIIVQQANYV